MLPLRLAPIHSRCYQMFHFTYFLCPSQIPIVTVNISDVSASFSEAANFSPEKAYDSYFQIHR
jgi:hypothetical protein